MYAPINQIQSPDDEAEEQDDVVQKSFLSYYTHNFGQAQDFIAKPLNQKGADFACSNAVSMESSPFKISCERLIEEGFDLAPPQIKAKKRKAEAADSGGGGRVVRAIGRKDRHSKVRTARGPRDRRVRLSPTTAIQFYDVQDRLGYDRPSKAIDWLIKEAKAAIDALDEHARVKFGESNAAEDHGGGFSFSQSGMREKHEHLNDERLANSGFSCFVDETEAVAPAAAAYLDQDYQLGFCSALNSTPQIFEANWEMARLQKMFTWNSVNENSGNATGGGAEYSSCDPVAPPIPGHTNMFREPLQSSIVNHASIKSDFAGFVFSNELSKIAASATPKQD